MSNLTTLFQAVQDYIAVEEKFQSAREARDTAIRAYLSEGNTVYQTAKLTGLTRQAVMKIRDRDAA